MMVKAIVAGLVVLAAGVLVVVAGVRDVLRSMLAGDTEVDL